MSSPPLLQVDPAETAPPADDGWVRPIALRQLQILGELAEQGLEVGRAVERKAKAAEPGDGADVTALATAHARVARAVRLTIMLQSKLVEELKNRDGWRRYDAKEAAQDAALTAAVQAQAGQDREDDAKIRAHRILARLIRAEHNDVDRIERLDNEACDQLDDEDRYGPVSIRPLGEVVAGICKDLGLSPDWAQLAEEAWARAEIESGAEGSPFATSPSQKR